MTELAEDLQRALEIATERYFTADSEWWSDGRVLRRAVNGGKAEPRAARLNTLVPVFLNRSPQDLYAPSLKGALQSSLGGRLRGLLCATFALLRVKFERDAGFRSFSADEVARTVRERGDAFHDADQEVVDRLFLVSGFTTSARAASGPRTWFTPKTIEHLCDCETEDESIDFVVRHAASKDALTAAMIARHTRPTAEVPMSVEPTDSTSSERAEATPLPNDSSPRKRAVWTPNLPDPRTCRTPRTELPTTTDIVLVVATDVEREAMLRHLSPCDGCAAVGLLHVRSETYYVGRCGTFTVALLMCEVGSGKPGASALAVVDAIDEWQPRAVIMPGIAFGRDVGRQRIGDVLVAEQVSPYELQRVGRNETIHRSARPHTNPTLLNRFRNASDWSYQDPARVRCKIRVGEVLSGEKLVDNDALRAQLFADFPNSIGGEMEGVGLWAAADRRNTPWILVKAVCDFGTDKHDDDQPFAASSSASLVAHVLGDGAALDGLPSRGSRVLPTAESGASRTKVDGASDLQLSERLKAYREVAHGTQLRWQFVDSVLVSGPGWICPLDEMYVPIRYRVDGDSPRSAQKVRRTIDNGSTFESTSRVVLSGNGGCGKSTALRWLYRRLLEQERVLPVFLGASQIAKVPRDAAQPLQSAIQSQLDNHAAGLGAHFPRCCSRPNIVESVVLLLDGWDEYGDRGEALRSELELLLGANDSIRVIATSRPDARSRPSIVEGFSECFVEPFEPDQARALLTRFYTKVRSYTAADADSRAVSVLQSSSDKGFGALMQSPFHLLLVARSDFDKQDGTKTDLYMRIIQMALETRPTRKAVSGAEEPTSRWCPEPERERLAAVASLAWLTTFAGEGTRQAWSNTKLESSLPETWSAVARTGYIDWLCDNACLLERLPSGELRFGHYVFQEFLAAWYAVHSDGDVSTVFASARERTGVAISFAELAAAHKDTAQQRALLDNLFARDASDMLSLLIVAGVGSEGDIERWFRRICTTTATPRRNGKETSFSQPPDVVAQVSCSPTRRAQLRSVAGNFVRKGTFVHWVRATCWTTASGLGTLAPDLDDDLEASLARACCRLVSDGELDRAVGRVIRGGPPVGLAEPWQEHCLRFWPSRRRKIAQLLQLVAAVRPTRAKFLPIAQRLLRGLQSTQTPAVRQRAVNIAPFMCYACILQAARGFGYGYPEALIRPWATYVTETWSGIIDDSELVPRMPQGLWVAELTVPGELAQNWLGTTVGGDGIWESYHADAATSLSWLAGLAAVGPLTTGSTATADPSVRLLHAACEHLGLDAGAREDAELVGLLLHCGGIAGFPLMLESAPNPEARAVGARLREASRAFVWPELEEPLVGLDEQSSASPIGPLWEALAAWLRRDATSAQVDLLMDCAAHPERAPAGLCDPMRWIVRGDIMTESGIVQLDELCTQSGVPALPFLDAPPELAIDWPPWAITARPTAIDSEEEFFEFERELWPKPPTPP